MRAGSMRNSRWKVVAARLNASSVSRSPMCWLSTAWSSTARQSVDFSSPPGSQRGRHHMRQSDREGSVTARTAYRQLGTLVHTYHAVVTGHMDRPVVKEEGIRDI